MFCENCGSQIGDDDRFCSSCGAQVKSDNTCANCGAEIGESDKFCSSCGAQVTSSKSINTPSGLIDCPDCGKPVSRKAKACPN
ncbi:zinc ribbon domain-containing protein [uncultured Methanobrevibacter sp.]|uniref:double zinc ribbon domain-containing protein n=1 Tax=uncultured Methanobrevibacter sp. TaxID=253161 RepID=UPI0025DB9DCB|nr:zinc ribbon domain-containing protein [uncultured Methanobrevibacter sp.]